MLEALSGATKSHLNALPGKGIPTFAPIAGVLGEAVHWRMLAPNGDLVVIIVEAGVKTLKAILGVLEALLGAA